jgi:FtsH-binding integral membrane protein
MGNRPKGYWLIFFVALAVVIAAVVMVRSADEHMRQIGRYMGWGAIVLLLIARLAFPRKTPPTPPMPKD